MTNETPDQVGKLLDTMAARHAQRREHDDRLAAAAQHATTAQGHIDDYRPQAHELPAMTTKMDADQFQQWIEAPGDIYIVWLPGGKSFVVKVPDEHNEFFVDMMRQIRMALGDEVVAQRATAVEPEPVEAPAPVGTITNHADIISSTMYECVKPEGHDCDDPAACPFGTIAAPPDAL